MLHTWQRTYIKLPKFFVWWNIEKYIACIYLDTILLMGSSLMIVIILLINLCRKLCVFVQHCIAEKAFTKKHYHVRSLHIHNSLQFVWLLQFKRFSSFFENSVLPIFKIFDIYSCNTCLQYLFFTHFLLFLRYKQLKVKVYNLLIIKKKRWVYAFSWKESLSIWRNDCF